MQTLGAFVYQTAASRQRAVEDGIRNSGRSGVERVGVRRASEQGEDVQLLTAPNSDLTDETSSPLR